jgi:hypothetical protein
MLIDFIAAVAVAFGVAGSVLFVGLIVRGLTGWRLPKWFLPASVGLGMIGFGVWNEYTWYARVSGQLPAELVVASAPEERAWYRPWTYVAPLTLRFVAVDRGRILRSTSDPGLIVAPVMILERWSPTRQITVAFDCTGHRRADLLDGAELNDDGTLDGVDWREVGPDDALVKAACDGG